LLMKKRILALGVSLMTAVAVAFGTTASFPWDRVAPR
jgi:hypothetical protein